MIQLTSPSQIIRVLSKRWDTPVVLRKLSFHPSEWPDWAESSGAFYPSRQVVLVEYTASAPTEQIMATVLHEFGHAVQFVFFFKGEASAYIENYFYNRASREDEAWRVGWVLATSLGIRVTGQMYDIHRACVQGYTRLERRMEGC